MEPSSSPTADELGLDELGLDELELLVDLADAALSAALAGEPHLAPPLATLPEALHAHRGAFVTLHVDGALNGCIGDVAGRGPLAHAVTRLVLSAAFADPRLPPLEPEQYDRTTIQVSVLSAPQPVAAFGRAELTALLRPGVDGLIVRAGGRAGLFLPDVWEQLPDPDEFLDHLWRKAGVPPSVWPDSIERFGTQHVSRSAGRSARGGLNRRARPPAPGSGTLARRR